MVAGCPVYYRPPFLLPPGVGHGYMAASECSGCPSGSAIAPSQVPVASWCRMILAQFAPSHLFLVGLLITSLLILYRTQQRLRRSRPLDAPSAPAASNLPKSHNAAAPAELRQWEVQMQEFARETVARLDSKMAALEHLLRAAQHERLKLEQTLAAASGSSSLPRTEPEPVDFLPTSQAHLLKRAAGGQCHEPHSTPKPYSARPYAEIYALADGGTPAHEIAQQTKLTIGEVELILGLRASEAQRT